MSRRREDDSRPSPEALLREAVQEGRGRLKVFLGAAPGVGKTYEMLSDGAVRRSEGVDVVIGVVETHGRAETDALAQGFDVVPRREIDYQARVLTEMNLDAILARRPCLVLVDELAHTNVPGSRHPKRYQDVEELLAAGIDVYSTVNIQHVESLNDVVASFTKVRVRETVPDRLLDEAELEVVDLPPDELIDRLKAGKVYVPHEATRALAHFFSKSNLSALRELALRRAAQAVDAQMLEYLRAHALAGIWAGGERLVVAVSELPGGEELVRAGKRMSDALRAPWTVVHVETPRASQFTEVERQRLSAALQLATQFGAQLAAVPATSVLEGIKAFAAEARATQLIVGKSARTRWFEMLHGSVVDHLVRETPGVAVHVFPLAGTIQSSPQPRTKRSEGWGSLSGYLISLLCVALVTGLGVSIYALGNVTNAGMLYLVPVIVAASRFGLRTGIVTGAACSLAYNFFFMPPLYTFTIQNPQNIITVLVLIGVAMVTSQLASRLRAQADIAQRSAAQNSALAGFARSLTGASERGTLGQSLCGELNRLFGASAVLLLPGAEGLELTAAVPPENRLTPIDTAAAKWAFDHNRPAGTGSDTLRASDWLFHPLTAAGKALGVAGLANPTGDEPLRSDQLPMLLSMLDQSSLALQRIALEQDLSGLTQLKERDRLRSALLSSVSHDLRTPLTTILAGLAELRRGQPPDAQLLASVEREAERLNRFVANLLDMARVEAGALPLKIEPVDLAEAVATAADDLRLALADHPVNLEVPPNTPLVMADPQLLHHCLINLIENAAKYSPEGTCVRVVGRRERDGIALSIIDSGPGIPVGQENRIFGTFTRLEGSDTKGGTGLGLAIVKGFAEAMGVGVFAVNLELGAAFTLRFPDALIMRGEGVA